MQPITASEIQEHAFQKREAGMRFKQTLFGGIGAAMIFGLVSSICTKLVPVAIEAVHTAGFFSAAALGPIAGLAAVAAVGIGCIYFGSQLLSKVITLEQENQARKIQEAKRGKSIDVPTLQTEGPANTVPGFSATQNVEADKDAAANMLAAAPSTKVDASSAQLDTALSKPALAEGQAAEGWASRVANKDTAQTAQVGV